MSAMTLQDAVRVVERYTYADGTQVSANKSMVTHLLLVMVFNEGDDDWPIKVIGEPMAVLDWHLDGLMYRGKRGKLWPHLCDLEVAA